MTRLELIEKRTSLKLQSLNKNSDYEVGKTYYNYYWSQTCKVISIHTHDVWGKVYKVVWDDGHETTHATRLDTKRDYLVIL